MAYAAREMRFYMRRFRARRLADAIARLGGRCVKCGTTEGLEFDHIDPATKVAPMTSMVHASQAKWDAELAKCQLLCERCHKEKHAAPEHGLAGYRGGCRCDVCSGAKRIERAEYERRRVSRLAKQRKVWTQTASPSVLKTDAE